MPQYPHCPAGFINNIADEGTKEEAVQQLQLLWNENCHLYREIQRMTYRINDLEAEVTCQK